MKADALPRRACSSVLRALVRRATLRELARHPSRSRGRARRRLLRPRAARPRRPHPRRHGARVLHRRRDARCRRCPGMRAAAQGALRRAVRHGGGHASSSCPAQEFGLVVGEPAEFRFLGSSSREDDALGTVLERWGDEVEELAPLETTLDRPDARRHARAGAARARTSPRSARSSSGASRATATALEARVRRPRTRDRVIAARARRWPARYLVGIDLGTTNSALAYVDTARAPARASRRFADPAARGDGRRRRAADACRRRSTSPASTTCRPARSRCRGPRTAARSSASSRASRARACRGGSSPRRSRGSATPASTGARRSCRGAPPTTCRGCRRSRRRRAILAHLRDAWDAAHPDAPLAEQEVVLTVPASFDEVARELTVAAAREAGLATLTLLEEPQAAFYAWLAGARAALGGRARRRAPRSSSSTSAAARPTSR